MIFIIDYGMGNLGSVQNALYKLGHRCEISSDPDKVGQASKIILPGVGSFAEAMKNLYQKGLDDAIKEAVLRDIPLLGICLGMQLLCDESEENGLHQGLGLVPGRVTRFQLPPEFKVPHMGWNDIHPAAGSLLFSEVPDASYFYFVHSYHVNIEDEKWVGARCNYGYDFVCAYERENLFAAQFHPEKSGDTGLKVLSNFACI